MAKCKSTSYIGFIMDYKISDRYNKQAWRYNPAINFNKTTRMKI